jgi:hypothetical protein
MKAYEGVDVYVDPHFLGLSTSWRWVVSFTPLPLYPRERAPGTHFIGGWVHPRASLDDMEKWKFFTLPGLELPLPLVVQPVASRHTAWAIPAPNYAWLWQSQEKPWSKSTEILKYKSNFRAGYRNERQIKPHSSWFSLNMIHILYLIVSSHIEEAGVGCPNPPPPLHILRVVVWCAASS